MEDTFDHIDDLIGKVLAGESTAEEKSEVDRWLSERAENRRYFSQVRTIFEKAGSQPVMKEFDTDAAWQNMRRRLREERKTNRVLGLDWSSRSTIWRIAAGIIIVIGAGYAAYQWSYPAPQLAEVKSGAATVQDTLPDGSTAFLNKKSEIHFEYDSRKKTRKVELKGEAYFEIKHEEEKPFIIETDEVLIQDLGTAFNVKAYPESRTVEVIVESGEVHIYTKKNPGLDIGAGEKGIYDKTSMEFSKVIKIDTNGLSYKTKIFSFNNTDLGSVIAKINEVYGSRISLANAGLNNCHLTVSFNNDSIDTVVDVLTETLGLKVTRFQDQIILDGSGCQ